MYDITWGVISSAEMAFFSHNSMQQDDGDIKELAFSLSFDFSVSLPEVQRRTLDVAVKNSGGFLSKDKGLLGKVCVRIPDGSLYTFSTQPHVHCFRPSFIGTGGGGTSAVPRAC